LLAETLAATDQAPTKLRVAGSRNSDVYLGLVASGIFSRTHPNTVAALAKQLEPEQFPAGHVVGAQSDFGGRVYVIISGKVKVSSRRPRGGEIVLRILGPSEIFGAITLFDPGSWEMSVTTLTKVLAVPIERDRFAVWMAEFPEVSEQVLRLFARRVKAATNSLVDFMFADARSRVARRLLLLTKRFGWREGELVRVVHDLTLNDFSRLVGVDPKAIRAALRDFEDRRWIRFEGNSVVIVDAEAIASVRPMHVPEACRV
jgi:CRP-like cAMP-binding protein